jgi:hypothetical protein
METAPGSARPHVRVFLPLTGSPFDATIRPGSAVVAAAAPEAGMLLVDYEGGSLSVNIVTFADRCDHASDRRASDYPTVARSLTPLDQLVEIGSYDRESGEVALNGSDQRGLLVQWLFLDGEALDRELLTEGSLRHKIRRDVLVLHARGDLVQAKWLAHHYQLDSLLD